MRLAQYGNCNLNDTMNISRCTFEELPSSAVSLFSSAATGCASSHVEITWESGHRFEPLLEGDPGVIVALTLSRMPANCVQRQMVQASFVAVGLERITPRMVGLNFRIMNDGANHL